MRIFLLSGKAQHGKNTFADIAEKFLKQMGMKTLQIAYGDYLKFVCEKYFEWNGKKDLAGRTLLQQIGTDKARTNNPDIWAHVVWEFLKAFNNEYDYVFITDCRFPNELTMWENYGFDRLDIIIVRIERINFDSKLSDEQKNHISETMLDNFGDENFNYIVTNDNIDDYKETIEHIALADFVWFKQDKTIT